MPPHVTGSFSRNLSAPQRYGATSILPRLQYFPVPNKNGRPSSRNNSICKQTSHWKVQNVDRPWAENVHLLPSENVVEVVLITTIVAESKLPRYTITFSSTYSSGDSIEGTCPRNKFVGGPQSSEI